MDDQGCVTPRSPGGFPLTANRIAGATRGQWRKARSASAASASPAFCETTPRTTQGSESDEPPVRERWLVAASREAAEALGIARGAVGLDRVVVPDILRGFVERPRAAS